MTDSIRIGALVLVTTLLSACQLTDATAAKATNSKPLPEVSYINVTPQNHVIETKMQGRIVASQIAEVRPQVSGIIQQRQFQEGHQVKKGEVLYRIEPAPFQSVYNEARANLHSAKASLATAQLKHQRYSDLLGKQGISQQDADDARAAYLEAKANIEKFEAALETAAINLEFTKVKAAISGYIGISNVTQGALVTAAQTAALATINTLDPIYVDMQKSSVDVLKLRKLLRNQHVKQGSTEVSLILEDGSEYSHKGQLKIQEVDVDAATGSVTLRAEFPNPDGLLLPGMFVRAQVNEAIDEQAILAPQQGIYHNANGTAYAYVISDDNVIERRDITTINAVDNTWLIASGLAVNDKLLVEGTGKVRPGSSVKPIHVEMNTQGIMVEVASPNVDTSALQGGL